MFGFLLIPLMAAPIAASERVGQSAGPLTVRIGDVPSYTFQTAPSNGVLVRGLEDLRGRPALFDFWGPHCPGCVQHAVPHALKLQETWGDDLQIVLVEVQGAGQDEAERFALRQHWLGGRSLWSSEVPFWPGGNSLPTSVLLGNDGQVLWKGNPLTQSREIDRLIAEQVRARRAVPSSAPEALRPAWTELVRGNLGRAAQLATEVEDRLRDDPIASRDLLPSLTALRRAIEAPFGQVVALAEAGFLDEADARLDELRGAVKDDAALSARIGALAESWSGESVRAERDASRRVARLLSRYFESGGDDAIARELTEFVAANNGTRAAVRAAYWARLNALPPR